MCRGRSPGGYGRRSSALSVCFWCASCFGVPSAAVCARWVPLRYLKLSVVARSTPCVRRPDATASSLAPRMLNLGQVCTFNKNVTAIGMICGGIWHRSGSIIGFIAGSTSSLFTSHIYTNDHLRTSRLIHVSCSSV